MKTTKKIIAITTLSLGAIGFANAEVPTTSNIQSSYGERIMQNLTDAQKSILAQAKTLFDSGKKEEAKALLEKNNLKPGFGKHMKGKNGGKHGNREAIHTAIAAGNYTEFQKVASTSPMAKIDQNTFNSLVPHFQALKNARTNIESILKNAGIEKPAK